MPGKEPMGDLLIASPAVCLTNGRIAKRNEEVCVERVIRLFLNEEPLGHLVASPSNLRELGAGFVISEGIADSVEDVVVNGDSVHIYARDAGLRDKMVTGSSGGLSTRNVRKKITAQLTIGRGDIFTVIQGIVSELWERTGGAHCSVLFSGNEIIAKSSDVGRHNTVDKVIGFCILNGIDLSSCMLGCTGRQPAGMVAKAVNAGIPIVVSKAATTDQGVEMARKSGLTLICRVKGDNFTVYAHPERIRDIREEDLVQS